MSYLAGPSPWEMRLARAFAGLCLVFVTACSEVPKWSELSDFGIGPLEIPGTTWRADTIVGEPTMASIDSTISFNSEDEVSGKTGCNTFLGPYRTNGDRVTFGPFAMTRMMCEPDVADQEDAFLMALAKTTSMEVERHTMYLRDKAGSTVMVLSLVE